MSLIWGLIVILLIILELMTIEIIAAWYAVGALVGLVISFISSSFLVEFFAFVIVGSILMYLFRNKTINFLKEKSILTSADKLIGEIGYVTKAIPKNGFGVVKVNNKKWTATSTKVISKDSKVVVDEVDGLKLKVEIKK